ncbi:MAG TPA: Ig-like domain-containing protein [Bacteroidales bacterium]|nr:Ig-like domain-containing protein [Bacteroidales bacterium]HPT11508.1 Ig-like domain-containing protein [Bacteroidales bacterium]
MYKIFGIAGMLLAAVALSCARQSSPTGGPRDKQPPVVLSSQPENGSKFFRSNSFEVTFDEYIVLDKINEKFMVSPPLKEKPEILLKGKKLIVKWDEDLEENTTYTFYFQDGIKDNNEGNVLNNFQYSFSTGAVLDSLSFTGNVVNAMDLEGEQDVLVMLYSNLSDTAPSKTLPAYITKPDISGGFCINRIKPGDYRVFALNDINGNRKYDGGEEMFAYLDSAVSITAKDFYNVKLDTLKRFPEKPKGKTEDKPTIQKPDLFTKGRYQLYLFDTEKTSQYLTSSDREKAGLMVFTLARPADTARFSFHLLGESDSSWYMEENPARDTFNIWIRDSLVYSKNALKALINFPFTDSTGKLIYKSDTVRMNFATRAVSGRRGRDRKPKVVNTLFGPEIRPGSVPGFMGINPLQMPDTSKMYFEQAVDTLYTRLSPVFRAVNGNSRKIELTNKLLPGASYILVCDKNAFTDIYGQSNDSTAYKFKVATEADYGKLNLNITGYSGKIIVQLLGEKEKVAGQKYVVAPCKVAFDLVSHGKYRIKVIYDTNGDGKWTTGSFSGKRQPEPVSYFPQELDVKINWEIDQDWNISIKNNKGINLRAKPELKVKSQSS